MIDLKKRMHDIQQRYQELEKDLSRQELITKPQEYKTVSKRYQELGDVLKKWTEYEKIEQNYQEAKSLTESPDPELAEMARNEIEALEKELERVTHEIRIMLLPKDPYGNKDIIMEIRAGTGGEEAGLFAGDLYRMYTRYAERQNWKTSILNANETSLGGFKEVIFSISGEDVYSKLKYESGGHRVQRVPDTEASGRIHTSAATVAVLPEADEVDVQIKPDELKVDTFRSSGHGGQHVNVTDSAIRITHLPTGLVVSCQDERSQMKNRAKAMKVLRARLLDRKLTEQEQQISAERKKQVGTGDRSQRIRTYNYPQNRVSDHRIGLTLYKLDRILEGEIDDLIDALILDEQTRHLEEM